MPGGVVICYVEEEMNERAALSFVEIANSALSGDNLFTVALSGGKTPEGLYSLLSSGKYAREVNWKKVHFFWGDERAVGPAHIESNYRMCSEALFEKLRMPEENIHRIKGEKGERAAGDYEKEIRAFFKLKRGAFPEFSLMLLGMGADGHTASIFPGTAAVTENRRIAVAVHVESLNTVRITLTPPVIINARNIIFLVRGREKAGALFKCLEGALAPQESPAQFARLAKGPVTWFVDREVASKLS